MKATSLALALIVPVAAPASSANAGTPLAPALSRGEFRSAEQQLRDEICALDAFAGGRAAGTLSSAGSERLGSWILYGRLGPFNFRNEMDSNSPAGVRFGMGRAGPRLTGRFHIGIHRQF